MSIDGGWMAKTIAACWIAKFSAKMGPLKDRKAQEGLDLLDPFLGFILDADHFNGIW